jgi:SH3 domain protein
MKLSVLFSLCFFLMVIPAHSETTYITDEIRVMVRSDAGVDRRIIAMPKSGTRVEVLEESEDGWSKVRLPNEKEGWILSRYLSAGLPNKEVIAKLKSENQALRQRAKTTSEESVLLKKERNDFQKALAMQTKTAKTLKESYETLKKGSSEYLSLKASYDKVSEDLETRTKRLAELEEKLRALQESQTLRWFLGGAAVLFVGFIVGFMVRRPRRRPSLL